MLEKINLVQAGALSVYISGGGVGNYPLSRGVESNVSWVICGAESGQGARPFDMEWARDLKDQCQKANVPFFFKQGRIGDKLVKMPELDGQIWKQYPEEAVQA
jgi:protein gp37